MNRSMIVDTAVSASITSTNGLTDADILLEVEEDEYKLDCREYLQEEMIRDCMEVRYEEDLAEDMARLYQDFFEEDFMDAPGTTFVEGYKPILPLPPSSGNVSSVVVNVVHVLMSEGLIAQAEEFVSRSHRCCTYSEVLNLLVDYVEVT